MILLSLILALLQMAPPATGVEPAFAFTTNAILQRDRAIPVWGTAKTDGSLQITLAGTTLQTYAVDGRWALVFEAFPSGGPHTMRIESDSVLTLENILFGDVWIAGGQSNMEWRLNNASTAAEDLPTARNPNIRYMHIPFAMADTPQRDSESAGWTLLDEESAKHISAVAYYFASMLQDSLDIPIGIIQSFRGATRVEPWTPMNAIRMDPDFETIKLRNDRETAPPSRLYNAMIHPITPIPAQGVIWYQGEGNAMYAYQYRRTFPTLIRAWRDAWNDPDLDFYFVQLANFKAKQVKPVEATSWPELREAQRMTLSLPRTGMAVALDVGDANDIHPRDKKSVGHRLARQALFKTYGWRIVHSGPEVADVAFTGADVRVRLLPSDSEPMLLDVFPNGFAVAGADRVFHWAQARRDGNEIILHAPEVPNPIAVRYAWADNPILSLFNKEGLPASSFRSDDWPGVTIGNR
jgi:sialate O-acetylesterase